MNGSYFLDYYHQYAGLCNQLYLITNHIHQAFNKDVKLFIHKMNIDIFKKKRVSASEVLDIPKTNKNLLKLLGTTILLEETPSTVEYIPKLCIYPVSSIEILHCLEFNQRILENVQTIKSIFLKKPKIPSNNSYNGIHFRLDVDAIIHYTFGKETYDKFMDLCNTNVNLAKNYFYNLDQEKMNNYISFLVKQYITFVKQIGFKRIWYICTSVTKSKIHDPVIPILKFFTDFIVKNGGDFYIPPIIYKDRELNALVDLLILRDAECLIGFEGSSFSEGYCFKVNSIRRVTKQFLFVKEYPEN